MRERCKEWRRQRRGSLASPHRRRGLLHTRIFIWFGVSILLTLLVTFVTMGLFAHRSESWDQAPQHVQRFLGERFARVWDDPGERTELARSLYEEFELSVELQGPDGEVIETHGPPCLRLHLVSDVVRNGDVLGRVGVCFPHKSHSPWIVGIALFVAILTLWLLTGMFARRIAQPLRELTRITEEIGAGKLSRRVQLGRHHSGEVGMLAESINEMVKRIEQQMSDQRELLAAVSHEVRTPLGHLAVLVELLRDRLDDPKLTDDIEQEVREIDSLMGELLASSRLDFSALDFHPLDARDVALRTLERAGLDAALLVDDTTRGELEGDATLLGRALANLIDNANRHGGGVTALRVVEPSEDTLSFAVQDAGPGFSDEGLRRAFDTFYRDRRQDRAAGSLGLGLALVKRIAVAHGGDAWAENLPGGGARVGLRVMRRPSNPGEADAVD